jgi:hypothetical protein
MKNDFCKIIFHPQTPLALSAKKLTLHYINYHAVLKNGIITAIYYLYKLLILYLTNDEATNFTGKFLLLPNDFDGANMPDR